MTSGYFRYGKLRSNSSEGVKARSFLWKGLGFSLGKILREQLRVMLKILWNLCIRSSFPRVQWADLEGRGTVVVEARERKDKIVWGRV